jgi:hypothetical protein
MGDKMIQDILSSDITVAGQMEFTTAAGPSVAVAPPGVAGINCHDANGNQWIEPGDNLLLQRLWVSIPYGFGQGVNETHLGIVFKDNLGGSVIIQELAGNSALTVPDICAGIDFPGDGLFIQVPRGTLRQRWNITAALLMQVSMVNLPAALAATTVKVQLHFMVLHSRPMQAAA